MFDLIKRARWDQAYDVLASGDPPMISRILALNTVFFIFFIIRRANGLRPMKETFVLQVQVLLLAANCLILFQGRIMQFISGII